MKSKHPESFLASSPVKKTCIGMALAGAACFALGLLLEPARAWSNWLLSAFYFAALALGAAFILALNALCRSSWIVVLRRIPEAMTGYLPVAFLTLLLLLPGASLIYEWAGDHSDHGNGLHAALLAHKTPYLNLGFFALRIVVFFGIWIVLARKLVGASRAQDRDGDLSHTAHIVKVSAIFMILFAATVSLASFDWLMSLDATWFSTIFGVYHFAGLFLGGTAAMIVFLVLLRRGGALRDEVNANHFHSLGQWLFAMSVFWAYIWYSQAMLIWYSNIPEETQYFLRRGGGAWWHVGYILNPLLNFGLPFLLLLPRAAKRSESMLLRVALLVLAGRWVDLWYGILPLIFPDGPALGYIEAGTMLGFAGVFGLAVFKGLERAPLVPARDPYYQESLHLHT